jgi:hypothetical protein
MFHLQKLPTWATRTRAMIAVGLLGLFASGCSNVEDAGSLAAGDGGLTGGEDTSGDPTAGTTGNTGDPTHGGEGDGDGDEDGDDGPEPIVDPRLELSECDPSFGWVLAYGLEDVQTELAPALVREQVLAGAGLVPPIPLGPQPFLNHFHFNYSAAEGPLLEVSGELWKPPMANVEAPVRYRLQYAVRAPAVLAEQRPPVDLAVVVDLGPSMAGEPLALAEEALAAIEASLVPGDRVTLIAAGEQPLVLTEGVLIENFGPTPLTGLLGEQPSVGSADVGSALALAYTTLTPGWDGQGQPRVLLISNGHFQVDDALIAEVDEQGVDGRYLVTVGLGEPDLVAPESLRQLAAVGRGPLLYDRGAEQIWLDLQARFTAHMIAAAIELQVTLELPAGLAIRDRDGLSQAAGEPRLGLLGANDSLVIHHELETCAELDPAASIRVTVDWLDPSTGEVQQTVWNQPIASLGFGSMDTRKGAATVAYVRALRAYRDGSSASGSYGAVLDAISLIAAALETQPEDPDLVEMSQVLGKLEG